MKPAVLCEAMHGHLTKSHPIPAMNTDDPTNPPTEPASTTTSGAAPAWENLQDKAATAAREAANVWQNTKGRATAALQTGERYVQEHPGPSVAAIFGAGLVIGALAGWAAAHESRRDPMHSLQQFLRRIGDRLDLEC